MSARDVLMQVIAADALIEAMVSWHGAAPARAEANDYINAILSALSAAGYAVVPREPTEAMVNSGVAAFTNVRDIWSAMLAAGEATDDGR